jgi:hypothetical protein
MLYQLLHLQPSTHSLKFKGHLKFIVGFCFHKVHNNCEYLSRKAYIMLYFHPLKYETQVIWASAASMWNGVNVLLPNIIS